MHTFARAEEKHFSHYPFASAGRQHWEDKIHQPALQAHSMVFSSGKIDEGERERKEIWYPPPTLP